MEIFFGTFHCLDEKIYDVLEAEFVSSYR